MSLQQPEGYFHKCNSDYTILLFKTLRWFSSHLEYDPHSSPAGPSLCRPPASCPLTAQQPHRLPAAPQTTEHVPAAETSLVLRLPSGTLLAFLFTPSLHLGFGLNFTSSNRPLAHPCPINPDPLPGSISLHSVCPWLIRDVSLSDCYLRTCWWSVDYEGRHIVVVGGV